MDSSVNKIETLLGPIGIVAIVFFIFVWSPHQLYLALF
jgi:hypothetical protein